MPKGGDNLSDRRYIAAQSPHTNIKGRERRLLGKVKSAAPTRNTRGRAR